MAAEMELEKLVVRIVADIKGAVQGFDELKQRARSLAQDVNQAMGGGGPGGRGPGAGGTGGAGDDPFRRQRETLAANTLKMEARDKEAAEKALDSQRQRAYEKQLRDDDALRNRQNAQRQRAYEQDQREQQRAVDLLGRQRQRAYEQDQRDQQRQQERGYQQEFREYQRRERLLERAVVDRGKKEQAGLDRETKRLTSEYDTRQRKLEQTLATQEKEKQKRFEASNRLQERTDRENLRNTERAAKEKEKIERQSARDQERQVRESAARRDEAAREAEARAQRRSAIAFGVGKTAEAIAAPFVIGAGLSVEAFAKFDLAMTESTSIMKVTEQETAKMRDIAKDLSTTGKQGPDELAKSFYYMASAGMSASQSMAALPQMQAFATAGAFDLALATSLANDSQKALGMSSRDATENLAGLIKVTDTLTKGAAMSNATVQQLAMSVSRTAGAAAKAFNRDIEEVVAVLGAFADQGVKGELAGNRYSMLLRHLGASAIKHGQEQKQLGFSVFDSSGKMKSMGDIMENLEKVLGPMSPQLRSAAMQAMGFEARMQQAILPLIGMSSTIKEYNETLKDAAGTTQDVAEKQMQAFANQIQMTANAVRVAAIEIGETLAPAVAFVAEGVKAAVQWFRSLDKDTKTAIVAVTAFTVAALFGIGSIILGLKVINVLTGGFPIVVGLLVTGFAALGLAAGVVVAKMGGIGKVVEELRYYAKKAWEWFQPLIPALESLWMTIKQVASDALDSLGKYALDTWNKVSGGAEVDWKKVRDTTQSVILFIEYSLRNLEDTAELTWAGIKYYSVVALNFILNNWHVILLGPFLLGMSVLSGNWGSMWSNMSHNTRTNLSQALLQFTVFSHNVGAILRGDFGSVISLPDVIGNLEFTPTGMRVPGFEKLELQLKGEFDVLKDKARVGFEEFEKQWHVERGIGRNVFQPVTDALDELPPEFNRKGETTGEQFMQGLNKGLKNKSDFTLVNTQADKAARRAYEDAIGLGGRGGLSEFVKIGKGAGSFKIPDEVKRLRDEGNEADNKAVLNRIANAAEAQVKNAAKSLLVKIVRF